MILSLKFGKKDLGCISTHTTTLPSVTKNGKLRLKM